MSYLLDTNALIDYWYTYKLFEDAKNCVFRLTINKLKKPIAPINTLHAADCKNVLVSAPVHCSYIDFVTCNMGLRPS